MPTETVPDPTAPDTYVVGTSYFGRKGYIEYIAGDAPVIFSVPHGGSLTPGSIADRTAGTCGGAVTTVTDVNTQDLARRMQQQFRARFGRSPHVIISRLSRRKLDPNRLPAEAACNNAEALAALDDWHAYIEVAKAAVLKASGKGWYMDIHGHGHATPRLELGYLVSAAALEQSDSSLDADLNPERTSSIRTISRHSPLSFAALLRGEHSLGTLYAQQGIPAIPSSGDPRPLGAPYFNGGDNTVRHGCGGDAGNLGGVTEGNICGVQVETHYAGVRDTPANRDRFGAVTAIVLEQFLREHWDLPLQPQGGLAR